MQQKLLVIYDDLELDLGLVNSGKVNVSKFWVHELSEEKIKSLDGILIVDGIFNQPVSTISDIASTASSNPNIIAIAFAGVPGRKFTSDEFKLIQTPQDKRMQLIVSQRDKYHLDNDLQILLAFGPNDYLLRAQDDKQKGSEANSFFELQETGKEFLESFLYDRFGQTPYSNYMKLKNLVFSKVFGNGKVTDGYITMDQIIDYSNLLYEETERYLEILEVKYKSIEIVNKVGSKDSASFTFALEVILEY